MFAKAYMGRERRAKPSKGFTISTGKSTAVKQKHSKHTIFGPRTPGRTWGHRPASIGFCYNTDSGATHF